MRKGKLQKKTISRRGAKIVSAIIVNMLQPGLVFYLESVLGQATENQDLTVPILPQIKRRLRAEIYSFLKDRTHVNFEHIANCLATEPHHLNDIPFLRDKLGDLSDTNNERTSLNLSLSFQELLSISILDDDFHDWLCQHNEDCEDRPNSHLVIRAHNLVLWFTNILELFEEGITDRHIPELVH
jgi:hypothetical protein